MDNAEIYLHVTRQSGAPIAGESVAHLFPFAVELQGWTWNLHNEKERQDSEQAETALRRRSQLIDTSGSSNIRRQHAAQDLQTEMRKLQSSRMKDLAELRASDADDSALNLVEEQFKQGQEGLLKTFHRALDDIDGKEQAQSDEERLAEHRASEVEEADRNRNFEFTFTKRVDIASTQLLNAMKGGEILHLATVTVHQRSSNSGLSLVITMQKLRLLDYALKVEVTDTMTDMLEQWTAEFGALGYVYKNRNSTGEQTKGESRAANTAQTAAKAASQGTVRTFAMVSSISNPLK